MEARPQRGRASLIVVDGQTGELDGLGVTGVQLGVTGSVDLVHPDTYVIPNSSRVAARDKVRHLWPTAG